MIAIITGDIVNSSTVEDPQVWLDPLKELFERISPHSGDRMIYRGDSFQIKVLPEKGLRASLLIISTVVALDIPGLNVRQAIGIGRTDDPDAAINEASGEAFIYSGKLLDQLTASGRRLGLRTPWEEINREFDMMFRLVRVILNGWTNRTAEVAGFLLGREGITQTEIAKELGLAQSTINAHIQRGSLHEIMELEKYYSDIITDKIRETRD